jgi:hypothetical protein
VAPATAITRNFLLNIRILLEVISEASSTASL